MCYTVAVTKCAFMDRLTERPIELLAIAQNSEVSLNLLSGIHLALLCFVYLCTLLWQYLWKSQTQTKAYEKSRNVQHVLDWAQQCVTDSNSQIIWTMCLPCGLFFLYKLYSFEWSTLFLFFIIYTPYCSWCCVISVWMCMVSNWYISVWICGWVNTYPG